MSRIGRNPIHIPQGVKVEIDDKNVVTVTGPLGTLTQKVDDVIALNQHDGVVVLTRANDENDVKAKHGLYRALINSMVEGVSKGFSKSLGVGYKLNKQGNKLTMNIGFSHPVEIVEVPGITIEVPAATEIKISGIDKQLVGQFAAKIRDVKPVEPYHGYGIRYKNEVVILKQGKAAGKGKK